MTVEHVPNALSTGALWLAVTVGGVFLAIVIATVNCAVCELVVRAAAWMYSSSPERRAEKRDAWLAEIAEMKSLERPAQAGSYLWTGLKRSPQWTQRIRRRRSHVPVDQHYKSIEERRWAHANARATAMGYSEIKFLSQAPGRSSVWGKGPDGVWVDLQMTYVRYNDRHPLRRRRR